MTYTDPIKAEMICEKRHSWIVRMSFKVGGWCFDNIYDSKCKVCGGFAKLAEVYLSKDEKESLE